MKYRCIYIIESFTVDGELVMRRFARNKRTAEKIARQCKRGIPFVRKVQKREHIYINPADVEG
jgi:hypothetical protein